MWRMLGMHMHPQAEVSSVAEAVDLIRQQRVSLREGMSVEVVHRASRARSPGSHPAAFLLRWRHCSLVHASRPKA